MSKVEEHSQLRKQWGSKPYWGLNFDYDPMWFLTEEQIKIQQLVIDLCKAQMRTNGEESDETYEYPRKNLNLLAEHGLLGLIIPKKLGGMGQNHVCASMVVETIARYACPSTAIVYVMHLGALAAVLQCYHDNEEIQQLLRRIDKDRLVGSLSYSDPGTGGHFWYPVSSKVKETPDGKYQFLKNASWSTSAGFADWYAVQTVSPNADGDYSNLTIWLNYAKEVRASSDNWKSLGMHGNQSGPMTTEGVFGKERLVGPIGDGANNNVEMDTWFMLLSPAVWTGIAMASLDICKKHVYRTWHFDAMKRVAEYEVIQDHFGEMVVEANSVRNFMYSLAMALDKATNNNDFDIYLKERLPRLPYLHWSWQLKTKSAEACDRVTSKMLHLCGGSGFKKDLGLERFIRDGKAAWVMGPSNEVLRHWVGKSALMGFSSLAFWDEKPDENRIQHEISKLDLTSKRKLAEKLLTEVELQEQDVKPHPKQDTDFDNPFNTDSPRIAQTKAPVALSPTEWRSIKISKVNELASKTSEWVFSFDNEEAVSGCLAGQYVELRVRVNGKFSSRYFSPVSDSNQLGSLSLAVRYENRGEFTQQILKLKLGECVEARGPCGGLEYEPNTIEQLSLLMSGIGCTPAIQIIRNIRNNKDDKTKVVLLFTAESPEELLYREELDSSLKDDKRFTVVYCINKAPGDWEGIEGFITKEMLEEYVAPPDFKSHRIIVCGGSQMSLSVTQYLQQLGYPSQIIYIYGPFGTEFIRQIYGRKAQLASHLLH